MTPEQIQARLASIRPYDFAAAEALARDVLQDARMPLHMLHRVVSSYGSPDGEKVRTVLGSLDELSVLPWLVAARRMPESERVQPLYAAYRAYEKFGQRVEELLRAMLSRRNLVPPPNVGEAIEMKPPPTRERDEAYLLLRRLKQPEEADTRTDFLARPEEDRDREIEEFLQHD